MNPTLLTRVALTILMIGTVISAQAAESIYISVKGAKQGLLKGDVMLRGFEGRMAGLGFRYEVVSPRDVTGFLATGRRQYRPVIITKAWDAASPQLFQALVTNEVLPEVVIDFVAAGPMGQSTVTHSIRLVNASVTEISQYTDPAEKPGRHLEDVSLSFQRIEFTDLRGKTSAMDDA